MPNKGLMYINVGACLIKFIDHRKLLYSTNTVHVLFSDLGSNVKVVQKTRNLLDCSTIIAVSYQLLAYVCSYLMHLHLKV